MSKAIAVVCCLVLAGRLPAAPAPFPKPARGSDAPLSVERLKQAMLEQHKIHADQIQERKANEWIVVGNTPMGTDVGMVYGQSIYLVKVTSASRGGKPQLTVTNLTRSRLAITR